MSRPLRYVPEGGALVEITINMVQGRYLLRPDKRGRVNELVLGVVGGCAVCWRYADSLNRIWPVASPYWR